MSEWSPLSTAYRVRLTKLPDQTASGIYLPEDREQPVTSAVVLGVGPGLPPAPGGVCSLMQAQVGETILFPYAFFQPAGAGEGIVHDEDAAAVLVGDTVEPLGEWLLVHCGEKVAVDEHGFEVPGKYRRRRRCGKVLDWGPGLLRYKGDLRGTRKTVYNILGLSEGGPLAGRTVYWKNDAWLLLLKGTGPGLLLVRASDLVAITEGDDEQTCGGREAISE